MVLPSFEGISLRMVREGGRHSWCSPAIWRTEFCQESLDSAAPPGPTPPPPPVGTAVCSCTHLPGINKQMALGFWDSSNFKCSF